jgi:hypothetical protein
LRTVAAVNVRSIRVLVSGIGDCIAALRDVLTRAGHGVAAGQHSRSSDQQQSDKSCHVIPLELIARVPSSATHSRMLSETACKAGPVIDYTGLENHKKWRASRL